MTRANSCESTLSYDLVFNTGGLPCTKWEEMTSGFLQVKHKFHCNLPARGRKLCFTCKRPPDLLPAYTSVRLDGLSASPAHDYYVGTQFTCFTGTKLQILTQRVLLGRRFAITSGESQDSFGTIANYLGRLAWQV